MMAISAVDSALWDLRGKLARPAGLPPARRSDPRPRRPATPRCSGTRSTSAWCASGRRRWSPRASRRRSGSSATARATAWRGWSATSSWCGRSARRSARTSRSCSTAGWAGTRPTPSACWSGSRSTTRAGWRSRCRPTASATSSPSAAPRRVPIATGEHEYTRWGFLQLLQAEAIDVIQADPDWCGGISELVKICTLASAFGRPVVPHGHSIQPALHVIAAQSPAICPWLEYLILAQLEQATLPYAVHPAGRWPRSPSRRARPRPRHRRGQGRAARRVGWVGEGGAGG